MALPNITEQGQTSRALAEKHREAQGLGLAGQQASDTTPLKQGRRWEGAWQSGQGCGWAFRGPGLLSSQGLSFPSCKMGRLPTPCLFHSLPARWDEMHASQTSSENASRGPRARASWACESPLPTTAPGQVGGLARQLQNPPHPGRPLSPARLGSQRWLKGCSRSQKAAPGQCGQEGETPGQSPSLRPPQAKPERGTCCLPSLPTSPWHGPLSPTSGNTGLGEGGAESLG